MAAVHGEGVLLPFGDRIVFDGLLTTYSMDVGPNIRKRLAKIERDVKASGGVTASLVPATKGPPPSPKPSQRARRTKPTDAVVKPKENPGRCEGCGETFAKRSIGRHLNVCAKLKAAMMGPKMVPMFDLLVEAPGAPEYFLHLSAPRGTTLSDLDRLLRDLWLECCGHMSAFKIAGTSYSARPELNTWSAVPERPLSAKIETLADAGVWTYEYDFGSTTALRLRPNGLRLGAKGGIRLLARNLPPKKTCAHCDKPAAVICTQCRMDGNAYLCRACLKKHPCGDEMALPVVNSPREGECGYTG